MRKKRIKTQSKRTDICGKNEKLAPRGESIKTGHGLPENCRLERGKMPRLLVEAASCRFAFSDRLLIGMLFRQSQRRSASLSLDFNCVLDALGVSAGHYDYGGDFAAARFAKRDFIALFKAGEGEFEGT